MVRRRGFGLPVDAASNFADLPAGLDYQGFQKAIRKERAYELAFEGHRRQDLVRWGIYAEAIDETDTKLKRWFPNANYIAYDFTKKGKHELFPIPQRDQRSYDTVQTKPGLELISNFYKNKTRGCHRVPSYIILIANSTKVIL